MKKYELALIFQPNLLEEGLNSEIENLKKIFEQTGALIEKIDSWGKKKLAYEIKKFNEGFYYFIVFSSETNIPALLESKIRINENIIRFLIVNHEA